MCRCGAQLGDFVPTHISKVDELEGELAYSESIAADEQEACIVEMELVSHPAVKQPKAIEADYGMRNGVLRIKSRAAMAGCVLSR